MRSSLLACALPLLLMSLGACKRERSDPPEDGRATTVAGYGEAAWVESETASIHPREVCEHLARMVNAEAGGGPPVDDALLAECESDLTIEAGVRGTDNWNAVARCVLEARTEADLDLCDRRHPLPDQPASGPAGPIGEREQQVCDHMVDVLLLEDAAESGEVPQLSRADRDALIQSCAEALAYEQRPQLSADDYERMLSCIEQARSSDSMRACQ